MIVLSDIYNLLLDRTFAGAFLGAFFAFMFFLVGEWIKSIVKVILNGRKEQVYLERYFNDLYRIVLLDKKILSQIVEDYKRDDINITDFELFPIRESAIIEVNDYIFINRMSVHMANMKSMNASLENANKLRNKINENLGSSSERVEKNARKSLENFIPQLKELDRMFDFHIDMIKDLVAENKFLVKQTVPFDFGIDMNKRFLRRKKNIEKERILIDRYNKDSIVVSDYKDKARNFGLKVE